MRRSLEKRLDALLIEAQKAGMDSVMYFDDKTGNVWIYTSERGVWFVEKQKGYENRTMVQNRTMTERGA